MVLIIWFLTFLMIVDCLFLILLVLMQLPKKEAGTGVAFGGAATDALFGAGSGNFLTKATKYCAVFFFALAVLLGILENHRARSPFEQLVGQQSSQPISAPVQPQQPAPSTPAEAVPATNGLKFNPQQTMPTNIPNAGSTNSP